MKTLKFSSRSICLIALVLLFMSYAKAESQSKKSCRQLEDTTTTTIISHPPDIPSSKTAKYHTWIRYNSRKREKGVLLQLRDSSVLFGQLDNSASSAYKTKSIPVSHIYNMSFRKKRAPMKGFGIGFASGFVMGVLLGVLFESSLGVDTEGEAELGGGFFLGMVTGLFGLLIGTAVKVLNINGRQSSYDNYKDLMKGYQVFQ